MLRVEILPDKGFAALGALEQLGEKLYDDAFSRASKKGAQLALARVREIYLEGDPSHKALHSFTVEQKGHTQPLKDEGSLAAGVQLFEITQGKRAVFAVGFSSTRLSSLADIHEYGAVIPVTPAMRGYLGVRGFRLRRDTAYLVVPARPVFAPALRELVPEVARIFKEELKTAFEQQKLEQKGAPTLMGRLASRLRSLFKR